MEILKNALFIAGDFPTNKECKYHCYPTCHPGQVGTDWQYGCLHPAWPQNKAHDFCPFVKCDGDKSKCEIHKKFISNYKRGLNLRIKNLNIKLEKLNKLLSEC